MKHIQLLVLLLTGQSFTRRIEIHPFSFNVPVPPVSLRLCCGTGKLWLPNRFADRWTRWTSFSSGARVLYSGARMLRSVYVVNAARSRLNFIIESGLQSTGRVASFLLQLYPHQFPPGCTTRGRPVSRLGQLHYLIYVNIVHTMGFDHFRFSLSRNSCKLSALSLGLRA